MQTQPRDHTVRDGTGGYDGGRDDTPGRGAGWATIVRIGGIAMGAWALAMTALIGELVPPIVVMGALFVVLGLLVRPHRRKLGLTVAALAVLSVAANAPFILSDLRQPEAIPLFVLTVLSLLATVALVSGGVAVFRDAAGSPVRTFSFGAVGVLVLAILLGIVANANLESDAIAAGDVTVTAEAVAWDADPIEVAAGGGLWVDNRDPFAHTFSVVGTDIDVRLPANSARRIDLTLAPGTYEVICAIPGHEAMTTTLVVGG